MKALILAGGFGTRLRPLTYTRPKHLLPIVNRPHIEHVLTLLQRHGITEAVLLTSYLADAFEKVIAAATERGFKMEVTHEAEPLGTAGALKNAEALVADDTFLAFNGDILTDVDLDRLLRFHREREAETTIFLTSVEDPSAFGVVPTADDGHVTGFIEKPPREEAVTNLINAGIYVMEPSVLARIPRGAVWSAEHQLFPQLVDDAEGLFATAPGGYWLDVGTPVTLLKANLDALHGDYATDAVDEPGPAAVARGPDTMIAAGASVASASIGAGAVVADGARVESSVLLAGVEVGAGAVVERSILGEGVHVGPGKQVIDQTVGDNERL